MAVILAYPRQNHDASPRVRQLKQSIEEDRHQSVAALRAAAAHLATAAARCGDPGIKALALEYEGFIKTIEEGDVATDLPDRLWDVLRRLIASLAVLEEATRGLPVVPLHRANMRD